jgi:cytochrome c5
MRGPSLWALDAHQAAHAAGLYKSGMAPVTWNEDPPDAARRVAAALAAVVLFVLLVFAAASALAQEPAQLSGYRGVDVFDAACAACHVKGEGGAPRIGDTAA